MFYDRRNGGETISFVDFCDLMDVDVSPSPLSLITPLQHSLVDDRVEGKRLVTSSLCLSLSLSRTPTP